MSTPPSAQAQQPIPPRNGPTASAHPLRELFGANQQGLSGDGRYVVLPTSVLERTPLGWQQQLAELLRWLQHEHAAAPWPHWEVTTRIRRTVAELSENQLGEAGVVYEIDDEGRGGHVWSATGERIEHPETTTVLVTVSDPMFRPA